MHLLGGVKELGGQVQRQSSQEELKPISNVGSRCRSLLFSSHLRVNEHAD